MELSDVCSHSHGIRQTNQKRKFWKKSGKTCNDFQSKTVLKLFPKRQKKLELDNKQKTKQKKIGFIRLIKCNSSLQRYTISKLIEKLFLTP